MKKQNILNWVVTALFLVGLVICYFFWGCHLDLIFTIVAVVVAIASSTLLAMQNKRIKKLNPTEE